jgi:hypothetical protein
MRSRQVVTVFLASPSDLADERKIAHAVIMRINRVFLDAGQQIDLIGWEDTLPGFTRPQEKINLDVDHCDLFLAVLWKRWGQPTGARTSGFEEEFERAITRRKATGQPEIWLFFKEVDSGLLADPGEQLKRVLAFRQEQERLKQLLFRTFTTALDWERDLNDVLIRHLLVLQNVQPDNQASAPPVDTAHKTADAASSREEEIAGALEQLTLVLRRFENDVPSNVGLAISPSSAIDRFSIARLSLFSSTWLSNEYSHEVLRVHEINLLYQNREQLLQLGPERMIILKTLMADTLDTSPGWFFLRDLTSGVTTLLLFAITVNDPNENIRWAGTRLLTRLRVRPAAEYRDEIFSRLLTDASSAAWPAFEYFGLTGRLADLSFLSSVPKSPQVTAARLAILARRSPRRAFEEILSGSDATGPVLGLLRDKSAQLTPEMLSSGLHSSDARVRVFSFKELAERELLSREQKMMALSDISLAMRGQAYKALILEGEKFSPDLLRDQLPKSKGRVFNSMFTYRRTTNDIGADQLIQLQFETATAEEVLASVKWMSVDGTVAYRILAECHFDKFGSKVRCDLNDGFVRLKEIWLLHTTAIFGEEAKSVIDSAAHLDVAIRDQYTIAALVGLARHGDFRDRELVLRFIYSADLMVRAAAARALATVGNQGDVPLILGIANEMWTEAKFEIALEGIKRVNSNATIAAELLGSGDPELVRAALIGFSKDCLRVVSVLVERLLFHSHPSVRQKGLAYIVSSHGRKFLVGLLASYPRREKYYYDVVTWLDRILYAPPVLRHHYRGTLIRSLAVGSDLGFGSEEL